MAKKLNRKNRARLDNWQTAAQQSHRNGDIRQTVELCHNILSLQAGNAVAHKLLGLIAYQSKQLPEAIEHFKAAIRSQPDNFSLLANLGLVYATLGESNNALHNYFQALKLNPKAFQVYNNMGLLFKKSGDTQAAIEAFNKAININQNYAEAHNNLGMVLEDDDRFSEAIIHYQAATRLNPSFTTAQSNLLFLQACYCLCPSDELLRQHREWDERQRTGKQISQWTRVSDPDPGRRLHIGYVSADFHQHPVATFIEPLLSKHDRNSVEIFCYAGVSQPDTVTHRLQSLSDHWCYTTKLSDSELERKIRADKIDILIDLGGHTANNRLAVFTRRPAPIQATYLGYCASTGLDAMNYWISDSILHPADTTECASETIYRLPRCWVCYQPPEHAPGVSQRVADSNHITFGSLNNVHKMSDEVYHTWANILHRLPGSHLLLKSSHLQDQAVSNQLLNKFATLGIDARRIELQIKSPYPDYLSTYEKIDIALDTFPRTGGTTAADALWMGVPVVTLAGERYVERLVASKLEAIGRKEWIATSTEEYIEKAITLAKSTTLLKDLRATQRQQIAESPLRDTKGLAESMEQAYRGMWHKFLEQLTQ